MRVSVTPISLKKDMGGCFRLPTNEDACFQAIVLSILTAGQTLVLKIAMLPLCKLSQPESGARLQLWKTGGIKDATREHLFSSAPKVIIPFMETSLTLRILNLQHVLLYQQTLTSILMFDYLSQEEASNPKFHQLRTNMYSGTRRFL